MATAQGVKGSFQRCEVFGPCCLVENARQGHLQKEIFLDKIFFLLQFFFSSKRIFFFVESFSKRRVFFFPILPKTDTREKRIDFGLCVSIYEDTYVCDENNTR